MSRRKLAEELPASWSSIVPTQTPISISHTDRYIQQPGQQPQGGDLNSPFSADDMDLGVDPTMDPDAGEEEIPDYIKTALFEVEPYAVYAIDGDYIRNKFNPEFIGFAHHYNFSFVPEYELWIDNDNVNDEADFFVTHMLTELSALKDGVDREDAKILAAWVERAERVKSRGFTSISFPPDLIPQLKVRRLMTDNGLDIWVVNGDMIRGSVCPSFIEAGHDLVYPFIPNREIWIDKDTDPDEIGFVLAHEMAEHSYMSEGMNYTQAHRLAMSVEMRMRE